MMIELRNLTKTIYFKNKVEKQDILKNINLQIKQGEFLSITGPSGAGKSSLIHIIGMLDREYEGEYSFQGALVQDLSDEKISFIRNKHIGFVFQNFKLLPNYTVKENILLPTLYDKQSKISTKDIQIVLDRVGLADKLNELPTNLSGGQQQRVAIARALINNPSVIIADEPTGALDSEMSRHILDILDEIHQGGTSIIMVTHSHEAAERAQRQVQILDGRLME